jgi:hypothetical protein
VEYLKERKDMENYNHISFEDIGYILEIII